MNPESLHVRPVKIGGQMAIYAIEPVQMGAATTVVAVNRVPIDSVYHASVEPDFYELRSTRGILVLVSVVRVSLSFVLSRSLIDEVLCLAGWTGGDDFGGVD
ncbi:hypothetical protein CCHR01_12929 [Colletotrichum chrysophilum]|uniref:Uncharacterized protein n=1 Tax=Colletotrichum chrysophilum TaxID=1836956 RepID=A0AAD9AB33_9PEZI|nr:hypothetical protein CCHR01_12929 [Colletotrichum chrysophilum]